MTKISNLKAKYESFYRSLGVVHCPILNEDIHFSNVGWKHIRFDSHGHKRLSANIAMRFKLLPFVPEVVKNAKTFFKEEGMLKNGNKILFYEISAEVEVNGVKKHVTVIISEIDGGKKHHLSHRYTRLKKQKSP